MYQDGALMGRIDDEPVLEVGVEGVAPLQGELGAGGDAENVGGDLFKRVGAAVTGHCGVIHV